MPQYNWKRPPAILAPPPARKSSLEKASDKSLSDTKSKWQTTNRVKQSFYSDIEATQSNARNSFFNRPYGGKSFELDHTSPKRFENIKRNTPVSNSDSLQGE